MGYLVSAIIYFLRLLESLIFIDALLSWVMTPRSNQFSKMLGTIIDPILVPCYRLQKRLIPNSPIDFSPLIAIVLIEFFMRLIVIIL